MLPRFSDVRIEADGFAVVSGTGVPGTTVEIRLGDVAIGEATVEEEGWFIGFVAIPPSTAPRRLTLLADAEGEALASEQTVVVAPRGEPEPLDLALADLPQDGPGDAVAASAEAAGDGRMPNQPASAAAAPAGAADLAEDAALAPAASDASAASAVGEADATSPPAVPTTVLAQEPDTVSPSPDEAVAIPDEAAATTPIPSCRIVRSWPRHRRTSRRRSSPKRVRPAVPSRQNRRQAPAPARSQRRRNPTPRARHRIWQRSASAAPAVAPDAAAAAVSSAPTAAVPSPRPGAGLGAALPEPAAGAEGPGAPPQIAAAGPGVATSPAAAGTGQPLVLAEDGEVRVIQPAIAAGAGPDVLATVALDTITYDEGGEVLLSGRATGAGSVRVYVDNRLVLETEVGAGRPAGSGRADPPCRRASTGCGSTRSRPTAR